MLLPGSEGLFPSKGFLVIKGFFAVTSRVGWQRIGCNIKRFLFPLSTSSKIFSGGNQTELEVKIKIYQFIKLLVTK